MNYDLFCSISHFAVYCNAILNSFIVWDFYTVVIISRDSDFESLEILTLNLKRFRLLISRDLEIESLEILTLKL